MNNGILPAINTSFNSNFETIYKSDKFVSEEIVKNSTIPGPSRSLIFKNYNTGGTYLYDIPKPRTNIGIPYARMGIYPYSNVFGSYTNRENKNFILLIDTASRGWFFQGAVFDGGRSTSEQLIPHIILGYNRAVFGNGVSIDWGDGTQELLNSNPQVHIYDSHGIYYLKIDRSLFYSGNYNPALDGKNDIRDGKVIGIVSWPDNLTDIGTFQFWQRCDFVPKSLPVGVTGLTMAQCSCQFRGMENWDVSKITSFAIGTNGGLNLDLSNWVFSTGLTSFGGLFSQCSSFNNGDPIIASLNFPTYPPAVQDAGSKLSRWDTSKITNMNNMFYECWYFNQNLSNWDVSKVTNFTSMFGAGHNRFMVFNGDLSNWQLVASGVSCSNMFAHNSAGDSNRGRGFTGKGLNTWNTSGLTNANMMFMGNDSFNQNLSGWNTSNLTNSSSMFRACSSFIGSGLENWNVRKNNNFSNMFRSCSSFNGSLSGWAPGADVGSGNCTSMFESAFSFVGSGLDSWNTSGISNMSYMFNLCSSFNTSLNNWDISNVTTLRGIFNGCTVFNQSLSNWNTSKVTDMNSVFSSTARYGSGTNVSLTGWNVSNVIDFSNMFFFCTNFNSSLSGWAPGANTAGTTCQNMFFSASNFTGSGLETWDCSKITNMQNMFRSSKFNADISGWNVGNVTNMEATFAENGFFNKSLNNWNVTKCTTVGGMFDRASNFNGSLSGWAPGASGAGCTCQTMFNACTAFQGSGLSTWNTSKVTNMGGMFENASRLGSGIILDLSGWDVSKCTNFLSTFYNATQFNGNVSGWKIGTSGTNINCNQMFRNCNSFEGSGLESWDVSKVVLCNRMFNGCNLSNVDLGAWSTSGVTNMANMFDSSPNFIGVGLNNWNTSNATNLSTMFYNCNKLGSGINLDLNNWDVSKCGTFQNMFFACHQLINQNFSNWNVGNSVDCQGMFQRCTNFNGIVSGWYPGSGTAGTNCANMFAESPNFIGSGLNSWNTSKINNMNSMFNSCTKLGSGIALNLSGWNVTGVGTMQNAFTNCNSFGGSGLENWNLAGLSASTALSNFAQGCNFPSGQYNSILNNWNTKKAIGVNGVANWRTDLSPHFGSSKYTAAGSGARAALVSYGWTITDGGLQV